MKFIIEGGIPLEGEVITPGCKNAALPIIAACLLTDEECVIENVPNIFDVHVMLDILTDLGAKIQWLDKHTVSIHCQKITKHQLDPEKVRLLRASILFMGPLLARLGKIEMFHPGGCVIGRRPVDVHFEALRNLGATITQDGVNYYAQADKLVGKQMFLDEVSVTATENAVMASVLAKGETIITPAACEPHVVDLVNFLKKMGADIIGEGTHTIKIRGVKKLKGTKYKIIPDQLDAGTFAVAAAATKGHIIIKNIIPLHLECIVHKLKEMGVNLDLRENELEVFPSPNLKAAKIQIDTWPRLPTDLQAPFCVLATCSQGTSLVHDWMYERRFGYIDELIRMGANITLCDPHRALVTGPTKLYGTKIISPDIRAGVALIIAALIAQGKSEIENIHLIERGYEAIDERLRKLGAKIQKVKKTEGEERETCWRNE